MKLKTLILRLALLLLCLGTCGAADNPLVAGRSSEGREFWVCFMKNFRDPNASEPAASRPPKLQLFITSSYDAKVLVEVEENGFTKALDIKANTVVSVDLPGTTQLRAVETPERLAVHITADTAVAVYGLNSRYQTTDTYMGLPVTALGTIYRAAGYTKLTPELLSSMSIIATEDNTEVQITPNATTSTGKRVGMPFTVTLSKGDVYSVGARWESIGPCDLTGSLITSNKPIAVFSGHQCAYVPPKVDACNHLVEQLPPVTAWGMHYYLGNLRERSRYTYRVIASENNTKVFEDAKLVAVLRAGEYLENFNVTKNVQLTADRPILVAQYAQGFKNGDSVGDPMMILVSPTQQFKDEYRFATPINGDWHHYINVVAPTDAIKRIRLDGAMIDTSNLKVFGESRYSIAQVQVVYGTHQIRSDTPFGLYSYGFGFKRDAYDAYGNMAGQSFYELSKIVDSLPPVADGKILRDDYQVTFRDDRPFDKGVKIVKAVLAEGLEVVLPKIDEGTPQASIRLRPASSGASGRVVLLAADVANNESYYTVCYMFDALTERFGYQLNPGKDVVCATDDAWMAGAYLSLAQAFHTADFTSTDGLTGQRAFNEAQGIGGYGGLFIGRRMGQSLILTGRLGIGSFGGTLLSPDSTLLTVLDPQSKTLVPYQEATTLSLTAPVVNLGIAAEYYPLRYLYVMGGIQASFMLGSGVEVSRVILQPSTYTFDDGTTERVVAPESLSSLNGMQFGLMGGLGFSYPVTNNVSVYLETQYTQYLGNFISDGAWKVQTLGVNAGARYRW